MRRRWLLWTAALGCGPQVMIPPGDDESTGAHETGGVDATTTAASGGATTTAASTSTSTTTGATSTSTTDATTGIDPDTSTSTSEASSDDDGCLPGTECSNDDDCGPDAQCISCICFGCQTRNDGTYAGCVLGDGTIDTSVCNDDAAECLVDAANPTAGVCAPPCTQVCDCPSLPGHNAQLGCGDLDSDGFSECIIGCTGGCPPGMVCNAEAICMWPA